ncbi:MAG: pyridoxal phosphate-dependent aminotransferase family protein, partial [Planctomycetota bacterium]
MASGLYPYFQAITDSEATEVMIEGRRTIMVGSNNYLGLTHHPEVIEASQAAIRKYGSGCTGSRFLNGTLDLHVELEEQLAAYMEREAALTFSTGFQTNLGTIATLVGKNDLIYCDRENHASILDACRLSYGDTKKYKHNDIADLERLLELHAERTGGKLLVADGVFSMFGDLVDLEGIVPLAQKYGVRLAIDEAHAVGVLGEHGRGACEHLGFEKDVDLILGTFSKSFASIGGFIAGPEDVIHYIKHHSRPHIFSAAIPPAAAAAVLKCLEIMQREPERRTKLLANADRMRSAFREMGFDTGTSVTPVVPIIIGDQLRTFEFWKKLFLAGVFTNPVTSPAVPPGKDLIRTSYMATHTDAELDQVLEAFHE